MRDTHPASLPPRRGTLSSPCGHRNNSPSGAGRLWRPRLLRILILQFLLLRDAIHRLDGARSLINLEGGHGGIINPMSPFDAAVLRNYLTRLSPTNTSLLDDPSFGLPIAPTVWLLGRVAVVATLPRRGRPTVESLSNRT